MVNMLEKLLRCVIMIYLIKDNYLLIVLILGFLLLILNHLKIDEKNSLKFKIMLMLIFVLKLSNILETHFSNYKEFNYYRVFFSFLVYSLRPFIVLVFISIMTKNKNIKYLYSLAIVNVLIYGTCFFNNWAFSFSLDNHFIRGKLGFTVHVICLFYMLVYLYIIFKSHSRQNKINTTLQLFIILSCVLAVILDTYSLDTNLFDSTLLIGVLIYYVFMYMEYNKKDLLTGLYNRQAFYYDMRDFDLRITAIIAIDMNYLKKINDEYGHTEGDRALVKISKVFGGTDKRKSRFYRIGGDEFVALCFDMEKKEVKKLIKKIKVKLKDVKYSCSFGYSMRTNKEEIYLLYKEADRNMYIEKEKYHNTKTI